MSPPSSWLSIHKIRLGLWMLAGEGFGFQDLRESKRVLTHAYQAGITKFDTAPVYGRGQADRLLSEPGLKNAIISTKTGLSWRGKEYYHNGSPTAIRSDVIDSLQRLNRSTINTLYLHWPDPAVDHLDSMRALNDLKADGLVSHIGVCNVDFKTIDQINKYLPLDCVQIRHSMLHNNFDLLQQLKISFPQIKRCIYSVFEQGLFLHPNKSISTKDQRQKNPYFKDTYRHLLQQSNLFNTPQMAHHVLHDWLLKMDHCVDEFVVGVRDTEQLNTLLTHCGTG
jgi:aryl-alcohol dehydrogenase-like predicted oxidoreductase